MTDRPAISVDFNNCDAQGRVRLNTVGAVMDLASTGVHLEDGTPLHLFDEEFELNGTAEFSKEESVWTARFNLAELNPVQSSKWQAIDPIKVIDGKILLPSNAPAEAGLYRLQFDENTRYIGEARDIKRRLGDYHTPGQGVEGDFRINRALKKYNGAGVEVMTGTGFATRSLRCIREHREIERERTRGGHLLNGGDIQEKIEFHESEITRLRAKLSKLSSTQQEENTHE